MKIGLFADSHYCNKESIGNRKPMLSFEKIKTAMESFKQNEVDLIICLGDLVDECDTKSENVDCIKQLCEMIYSYNIPFFSLMGNHDYQNFTRKEFNTYTKGAYPPFVYEKENVTLVFLDCNYDKDGNVYKPNEIDWTDANLPVDQLKKLESILKDKKKKKIYIFSHQNIDNTIDESHVVKNSDEIREAISNSKSVKMVIQGHYHLGKDTKIDKVLYHTLKAMCEFDEEYFEIIKL